MLKELIKDKILKSLKSVSGWKILVLDEDALKVQTEGQLTQLLLEYSTKSTRINLLEYSTNGHGHNADPNPDPGH